MHSETQDGCCYQKAKKLPAAGAARRCTVYSYIVAVHEWSCDLRAVGEYRLMGCSISKSPRHPSGPFAANSGRCQGRRTTDVIQWLMARIARLFWWRYARAGPGGRDAFGPGETGRSSLRCRRVLVSTNLVGIEVGWIRICRGELGGIDRGIEKVLISKIRSQPLMHVPFGNVC